MSTRTQPAIHTFNPYSSWFGIRTQQRPLNAYQLLGLQDLEGDRSRIRLAAERRRSELELHQGTDQRAIWESVSSELEEAVRTLLSSDEKALLDASILRRQAAVAIAQKAPVDDSLTLHCRSCQTDNSGTRRFCKSCGESLWVLCPACEHVSPVDEKFCGSCGMNHEESLAQAISDAEATIAGAVELCRQQQLPEAITRLHQLAASRDSRLEKIIHRALELRGQCQAELLQQRRDYERLQTEALQYWQSGESERAHQLLERIPQESLSEKSREILAAAENRNLEIQELEKRIKAAVQEKRLNGVGQLLDQLLTLRPDHPQANQLAHRMAARLKQAALKHQADGVYEKAFELLEQTPQIARGDEFAKLWEHLAELACLSRELRRAPFVDAIVLGLAERLAALAANNARVVEKCQRILATKHRAASASLIPCVPQPQRTAVGIPVDLWSGPKRIRIHEKLCEPLQASVMAVAMGLALQGLDIAQLNTNLRPEKKGRLPNLPFGRRKSATSSWGIDIGHSAIKAVHLIGDDPKAPYIDQVIHITYDGSETQRIGTDHHGDEITTALAKLKDQADFSKDRICIGLSTTAALVKVCRLPLTKSKQLKEIVQYEARHQFPLGLDELYWDSHIFHRATESNRGVEASQPLAILLAAKRDIIDARLEMLQNYFHVDVVQSSALALHNLFAHEMAQESSTGAIGVLDFGAANSHFIAVAQGVTWTRSMPLCGDSLINALSQEFKLTSAQAEQLKREPLRAKKTMPVMRALSRALQHAGPDIRRTIEMFHRDHRELSLERLVLVGGTARVHGLLQNLWFGE